MIGCIRCHEMYADKWTIDRASFRSVNPPLDKHLDAWAEHIWLVMTNEQWPPYLIELYVITGIAGGLSEYILRKNTTKSIPLIAINSGASKDMFTATPLHHLEAALRMLGKWDEWRESCER